MRGAGELGAAGGAAAAWEAFICRALTSRRTTNAILCRVSEQRRMTNNFFQIFYKIHKIYQINLKKLEN
jgi:hypothetical protein